MTTLEKIYALEPRIRLTMDSDVLTAKPRSLLTDELRVLIRDNRTDLVTEISRRHFRWLVQLPHENVVVHFHPAASRAEVLQHPRYKGALDLEALPEGFDIN